jgi:SAM-dependent methyltransferase
MNRPRWDNPQFARAYIRCSERAEGRGAAVHRRELVTPARGVVCEVGAGNGLAFAHYPAAVERVLAIEPEPTLRAEAVSAAASAPVPVHVVAAEADRLPLPDTSTDAVVASLVLCSVPDLPSALGEIRRVLRPGGMLAFYEHVRSRVPGLGLLEDAVTPLWSRMAGGCHPNRDTVAAIRDAGFELRQVRRFGFSQQRAVPPTAHVLGFAVRR